MIAVASYNNMCSIDGIDIDKSMDCITSIELEWTGMVENTDPDIRIDIGIDIGSLWRG